MEPPWGAGPLVPAEAGTSQPFPRRSCGGRNLAALPPSFLRRLEPRSPSPVVPAEAGTSQPCPSSFQRRLESRGRGSLALNKVDNRPRNLAPLIAGPRVNRTPDLATLATLIWSVSKAMACFPRLRGQGGHRIHKLGTGAIDPVYSRGGSYRRGLSVLPVRRSCNQRTQSRRDRGSGRCHTTTPCITRHSSGGWNPVARRRRAHAQSAHAVAREGGAVGRVSC